MHERSGRAIKVPAGTRATWWVGFRAVGALLVLALAWAPAARADSADVTATDIQVAARALGFMSRPPKGRLTVGIVYSRQSPASEQAARRLRDLLAGGYRVGAVEFAPLLVEAGIARNVDVDLYFLSPHLRPVETPPLVAPAAAAPRLCVTTDIAQVEAGRCILGVRSRPRVEVLVNRSAAAANGITFSTVFRVMITEL